MQFLHLYPSVRVSLSYEFYTCYQLENYIRIVCNTKCSNIYGGPVGFEVPTCRSRHIPLYRGHRVVHPLQTQPSISLYRLLNFSILLHRLATSRRISPLCCIQLAHPGTSLYIAPYNCHIQAQSSISLYTVVTSRRIPP